MKTTIKLLFAGAAAAAALFLAPAARADASTPKDIGVTNVLAASATQTADLGTYVDIRNWENVSLTLTFYGVTASTNGNVTLTFSRTTGDPTSSTALWETTPKFTWAVPATGTNVIVGVTNLPRDSFSGITGFKIVSAANGTAGDVSGVKLLVTAKEFTK